MRDRSMTIPSSHVLWPGMTVPTAAHGDEQILVAPEADSGGDVGRVQRPHDQAGPAIDHAVPDAPRVVVAGVARRDDVAAEDRLESCSVGLGSMGEGISCIELRSR